MEPFLQISTWVHASLGLVCLVSGVLALTAKKAKGRHTNAGRVFLVSLTLTFFAILINIVVQKNVFMLCIGWLAVYAGVMGWRALLRAKDRLAFAATAFDYTLVGTTALLSVGLIVLGIRVLAASNTAMGLVCLGFGLLGALMVRSFWQRQKNPPTKPQWLALHIHMMAGAFSAALTAFFAIQLSGHIGGFEWVVWVAPSLIMSRYATNECKRRGLEKAS